MKNFNIFVIGLYLLISCQKNDSVQDCGSSEIFAPDGYKISKIGENPFFGDIISLQFLHGKVGYATSGHYRGTARFLHKTTNGGLNWININYDREFNETIFYVSFQDENTGIISLLGSINCRNSDCHLPPKLLLTRNGGESWSNIIIENVAGQISQLQFDNNHLYGLLFSEGKESIIKSDDYGDTWETILNSESLLLDEYISRIIVSEDRFYVLTNSGRLMLFDSLYQIENVVELQPDIRNIEILDSENFIIAYTDVVQISSDGGDSWEVMYNGKARIGGFESPSTGFLIVGKDACRSNYRNNNKSRYRSQDAISITKDGGLSWAESSIATPKLGSDFTKSQNLNPGEWILAVGDELFRLTTE